MIGLRAELIPEVKKLLANVPLIKAGAMVNVQAMEIAALNSNFSASTAVLRYHQASQEIA